MKKTGLILSTLIVLALSAFTVLESINWKLKDDTYTVSFKGGKVDGTMKGLKATIMFDEADLSKSKITASMDVKTINTGNGMMNKHAKSEDALNADKYPLITFVSESIVKKAPGYEAKGKLTLKDVTKEITMPFIFEAKGTEGVFKGNFSIVPKDYNITRGGTPDKLDLEIIIPVVK